ncbi:MAG: radical SAM protein [Chitinivibrionales bacterium]|nr:radical SAM protein [Chitinivibrionales bacterium]
MFMSTEKLDVLLAFPGERFSVFDAMVPLGPASLAAVLEENDFTVKVVDFNRYHGDFRSDLATWQPALVGVGGTTPTRKGSFLTAQLTKEVLPGVPVVYGGVHASFAAQDTLEHVPFIDYIVKGEGEYTLLELCRRFVRDEDVDIYALDGLCWRNGHGVKENPHARLDDLTSLPPPARHLLADNAVSKMDIFDLNADFLMTSRGCPAGCKFCSASRMFPGGVRYRSMQSIQDELDDLLSRKKIQAIKLFDSTFTADHRQVRAFCQLISRYNLLWECEIRADTVDYALLRDMRNAGCCYINVGLETTSARLLMSMAKNISVQQTEQVLDWCRLLDIKTKVFFTFGHLTQTFDECLQDIRYMASKKESIDFFAATAGMRVYPGTPLEKRMLREGLLPHGFSWADYSAPLSNLLVGETGDVLLLRQKQLPLWKLLVVLFKLLCCRTLLNASYVRKMFRFNLLQLKSAVLLRFVYCGRVIRRFCRPSGNEARRARISQRRWPGSRRVI